MAARPTPAWTSTSAGAHDAREGLLAQGLCRAAQGGQRAPQHPPAAVRDAGHRTCGPDVVPRPTRGRRYGRRAAPDAIADGGADACAGPCAGGALDWRTPRRTWAARAWEGAVFSTRYVCAGSSRFRAVIDLGVLQVEDLSFRCRMGSWTCSGTFETDYTAT